MGVLFSQLLGTGRNAVLSGQEKQQNIPAEHFIKVEYIFTSTDLALKSAWFVDFRGKSRDSWSLRTQWIVNQICGFMIVPVMMFGSWVLNEMWLIDLSSALVSKLMISSKLFLFLNKAHLYSGACYLNEINNAGHSHLPVYL